MSARILVIEDNATNLELMTYLLNAYGHTTIVARDGAAGVAEAKARPCDLIISDIHLPVMDGYEVARRLRGDRNLARVPLIAVTALAMVGDQEKIQSAGFDGYLAKPISAEQFVEQIERYLPVHLRHARS
jgi:two-component system cell cycle response regulator